MKVVWKILCDFMDWLNDIMAQKCQICGGEMLPTEYDPHYGMNIYECPHCSSLGPV